ncbi:CDC14-domain-containing protein [Amylocystis lapponica]|nr:CDC14-domain-containing protein [Amylocystis lapponica]
MHMKNLLQDVLDEFGSPRTSTARIGQILTTLEGLQAEICVQKDPASSERLRTFTALQDTFECNVPSRILSWMSSASSRLEDITGNLRQIVSIFFRNRGQSDSPLLDSGDSETTTLSSQLIQALSITQGIALIHDSSKQYLGRRYPIQVLLDLLLTSRHVEPLATSTNIVSPPSSPESRTSTPRSQKHNPSSGPLASAVLDTLLCILVDSSPSLRVFEEQNGVQVVVRILKRSGTPREVRFCTSTFWMKPPSQAYPLRTRQPSNLPRRAPRYHRTVLHIRSADPSTSPSHRSHHTPDAVRHPRTNARRPRPPPSPSTAPAPALLPSPRIVTPPTSRTLLMLRKDVDYTPQSPKKAPISRLGVGARPAAALRPKARARGPSDQAHDAARARGLSASSSASLDGGETAGAERGAAPPPRHHRRAQSCADVGALAPGWAGKSGARTMEEKKEILGGLLGNVDALVEGVRKAGIWGLG